MLGITNIGKSLDDFDKEIAATLDDPSTSVYVDTNILAFPYKLHEEACDEFLRFFQQLGSDQRLQIPSWCAHEYFKRVQSGKLSDFTSTIEFTKLLNQFSDHLTLASLATPSQSAVGCATRSDIGKVKSALRSLTSLTKGFSKIKINTLTVQKRIEETFGACVAASDVAKFCAEAAAVGEHRYASRLPPGFQDRSKKENSHGDLVIWLELLSLAELRKGKYHNTVFITNDEKIDWRYAPAFRMDRGGQVGNEKPRLLVTDPRLEQEFKARVGPESRLVIVSLQDVVRALSAADPGSFVHLSAALQVMGDEDAAPATQPVAESLDRGEGGKQEPDDSPTVPFPPAVGSPPDEPPLSFSQGAVADRGYHETTPNHALAGLLREFKSHNWYRQNDAISSLSQANFNDLSLDEHFVVGRNIYQSAVGNAFAALHYLDDIESSLQALSSTAQDARLAGLIYEAFFDASGKPSAPSSRCDQSFAGVT